MDFYYVYILVSLKDSRLYIGFTKNLQDRLREHNGGVTESTKNRRPLKLVYYEAHLSKEVVLERERYFKSGWGRKFIKEKLKIDFKV